MIMEICEKCGKPKTYISLLTGKAIPCLCECEKKRREQEEKRAALTQRLLQVAGLRGASLLGNRYSSITFKGTETGNNESFDNAFIRCKKYCDNAREVYENGYGIYLYGDRGTGKTHLAACIVNDLLEQLVPVVFTNLTEIGKIAFNPSTEFDRICKVDFLVIDDIGAQRVRNKDGDLWLQEKVYELINTRYNEMLPTIFTSNYSIGELVTECGISSRTVDRIAEMSSAVFKLTGASRRIQGRNGKLPF